jgi:hypothetical protein
VSRCPRATIPLGTGDRPKEIGAVELAEGVQRTVTYCCPTANHPID